MLYVRDYEDGDGRDRPRERLGFARETSSGGVTASTRARLHEGGFEPGKVYEVVYTADGRARRRRRAAGDARLHAFLRHGSAGCNPPAGFERAYGFGVSQSGRFLRHFLYLGLNLDEDGPQVFDGLLPHVAGGRRGEFNHRFAQPSDQSTPASATCCRSPTTRRSTRYSERRDGLLRQLRALGGVPKCSTPTPRPSTGAATPR